MALTESSAFSRAFAGNFDDSVTGGSFTPAAGSLIAVIAIFGNSNNDAESAPVITDSVSGTWTTLAVFALPSSASAIIAVKDAGPAPVAQTVTGTAAGASGACTIIGRQFAGAASAARQNGAAVQTGQILNQGYTAAITPSVTGSQVIGGYATSSAGVTLTANGSTSIYNQDTGLGDTECSFEAAALSAAGSPVTLGFTNAGTHSAVFVLAEIVLPYAAGTVTDRHHHRAARGGGLR